jgi:hypothetical protein
MRRSLPTRFWVEVALCIASGALTALTITWTDWIERIFGIEPDGRDGSTEWALVLAFAGLTIAFIVLCRRAWWRHARGQSKLGSMARSV